MPSEMPQLKIRIPEDMMARLRALAEKKRRSLSSLAQEYIEEGMERDAAMDDYYEQQEREQRAALNSLTPEQFDELIGVIKTIKDKTKKPTPKKK